MRRGAWALALFCAASTWAEGRPVRYAPLMESAVIPAFRHRIEVGADLGMDAFQALVGTETLKGLFTRARPFMEYRYVPAPNAEILFRGIYTAQNIEFTAADGRQVHSRYSAGFSAPTIGFKLLLGERAAFAAHTTPPTAAARDPRLGDGAHYGGKLLLKAGRFHLSAGHTTRLEYRVHEASRTYRRNPGDVTELAGAFVKRDGPSRSKNDYVGPLIELHGLYADRERIEGEGIRASAALSGKVVVGFVLGKINRRATHLTRVGLAAGFGDLIHKTEDPLFGAGDLHLILGYGMTWGRHE